MSVGTRMLYGLLIGLLYRREGWELRKKADLLLYEAKHAGRARVRMDQ